jgi:hypothetical protein
LWALACRCPTRNRGGRATEGQLPLRHALHQLPLPQLPLPRDDFLLFHKRGHNR